MEVVIISSDKDLRQLLGPRVRLYNCRKNQYLDEAGLPSRWTIDGATTFGNPVDESFELIDSEASWTDSTGSNQVIPAEPAFYVPNDTSPYWLAIAARAHVRVAGVDELTQVNRLPELLVAHEAEHPLDRFGAGLLDLTLMKDWVALLLFLLLALLWRLGAVDEQDVENGTESATP